MVTPTLLTLPVELQTWIYHLSVVQDYDGDKQHGIQLRYQEGRNLAKSLFPLLQTCRQIYQLARPIYYNSNTFVISDGDPQLRSRLLSFFTALGTENVPLCRSIKLDAPRLAMNMSGSCMPILTIDFKFGSVLSWSDNETYGLSTGKSFHEHAADLCNILMLHHHRPRTRSWPALLAREITEFLITALEAELSEEDHGWFFPFGRE